MGGSDTRLEKIALKSSVFLLFIKIIILMKYKEIGETCNKHGR